MKLVDKRDRRNPDGKVPTDLLAPDRGNKVYYDSEVKGFGCRVTAAGARSFILNYRTRSGRERRFTIGSYPDWSPSAAREEAKRLKKQIDYGEDPMAEVEADRAAKTVADLCDRYEEEHLPKKRESSQKSDRGMIAGEIRPVLKHLKVSETSFSDIDGLHRKITQRGRPWRANRVLALLSKMFSLAVKWGWRSDNPCRGVERNQEPKRNRYLSGEELKALTEALAVERDQQAANIVRLLLLTGARSGEVRAARWAEFDLEVGVWTKPGATTKQKTEHRVPLSAPALQLLAELRRQADEGAEYVFPGPKGYRAEIKEAWERLCLAAGIVTTKTVKDAKGKEQVIVKPSARLHDLRHTYASILASAGLSLPVIGALLGHTQPATTARYSHLFDDPLRAATERVGAIVSGKPSAVVVPIKSGAA